MQSIMSTLEIRVPDIGTDEKVDVVEVLVAPGDEVSADDAPATVALVGETR